MSKENLGDENNTVKSFEDRLKDSLSEYGKGHDFSFYYNDDSEKYFVHIFSGNTGPLSSGMFVVTKEGYLSLTKFIPKDCRSLKKQEFLDGVRQKTGIDRGELSGVLEAFRHEIQKASKLK